jgi:hypothetical protein
MFSKYSFSIIHLEYPGSNIIYKTKLRGLGCFITLSKRKGDGFP